MSEMHRHAWLNCLNGLMRRKIVLYGHIWYPDAHHEVARPSLAVYDRRLLFLLSFFTAGAVFNHPIYYAISAILN